MLYRGTTTGGTLPTTALSSSRMEPILTPQTSRLALSRINYPDVSGRSGAQGRCSDHFQLWRMYKTAASAFWTAADIDKLEVDVSQWGAALNGDERTMLSTIVVLFATSDRTVFENLTRRMYAEVPIVEARCFYAFQVMM